MPVKGKWRRSPESTGGDFGLHCWYDTWSSEGSKEILVKRDSDCRAAQRKSWPDWWDVIEQRNQRMPMRGRSSWALAPLLAQLLTGSKVKRAWPWPQHCGGSKGVAPWDCQPTTLDPPDSLSGIWVTQLNDHYHTPLSFHEHTSHIHSGNNMSPVPTASPPEDAQRRKKLVE